ncbi:hypothetical protein LTR66_002850 [Elasticomyces elasticus]|nr:hypothetical protein LTR66_002850 [Elasticomyces elasticus]
MLENLLPIPQANGSNRAELSLSPSEKSKAAEARIYKLRMQREQYIERKQSWERILRKRKNEGDGVWRTPWQLLESSTPEKDTKRNMTAVMWRFGGGARGCIDGNLGEFLLDIFLRTDCEVRVGGNHSNMEEDGSAFRELYLFGTALDVAYARTILTQTIKITKQDGSSSSLDKYDAEDIPEPQRAIRAVWARKDIGMPSTRRADEVPHPAQWTAITFTNHIADLTNPSMSRLTQRRLYGPCKSHIATVTRLLMLLFTDKDLESFYTPSAISIALDFLLIHRKHPQARRMFLELEASQVRLSAGIFETFLRQAAAAQDLHNFRFTLSLMVERQHHPTWKPWAALIQLVRPSSATVATFLIHRMRHHGLLENLSAVMEVAEQTVHHDLGPFLDGGGTMTQFLEAQDQRWACKAWLSVSCANRLLDILGSRGHYTASCTLLDELQARERNPSIVSLNTLLAHCSRQKDISAAMAHLTLFERRRWLVHGEIDFDAHTFHILFRLAWTGRYYNLLRVVWRYACMYGRVSYSMQVHFRKSLQAQESASPDVPRASIVEAVGVGTGLDPDLDRQSRGAVFRSRAGRFVVGVDNAEKRAAAGPASSATATVASRKQQAKTLFARDASIAGSVQALRSMHELLLEAFEKDKAWKAMGERELELSWMLENAVKVPVLRVMATPRQSRSTNI